MFCSLIFIKQLTKVEKLAIAVFFCQSLMSDQDPSFSALICIYPYSNFQDTTNIKHPPLAGCHLSKTLGGSSPRMLQVLLSEDRNKVPLLTLVAVLKGKGGNYPPSLSPSPVNERRWESLFHHQSPPFDRILAVQLINVLHRAARRPVTKLKEPHKWPSPGDKPLHRITY